MINLLNIETGFKQIYLKTNKINKEISTGKKELNSLDLNKILNLKNSIKELELSNKQIQNFKLISESADNSLKEIKLDIDKIKVLLIKMNTDTTSNKESFKNEFINLKENIINKLNTNINGEFIFQGENNIKFPAYEISYKKVLVSPGNYKTFDVSSLDVVNSKSGSLMNIIDNIINNIDDDNVIKNSISYINDSFDQINIQHAKIGFFNEKLNNYLESNNTKKTFLEKEKILIEDTDYTESIINLNILETQYSALAMTVSKIEKMNLVNFLK